MHKERLLHLLEKHFHKTISPAEHDELSQMMLGMDITVPLEEWMSEKWRSYIPEESLTEEQADQHFRAIVEEAESRENRQLQSRAGGGMLRSYWMRVAAVLLIALTGTTIYFLSSQTKDATGGQVLSGLSRQDVSPGGNFATLTLADGSKVILDSVSNGLVTSQGNVRVVKSDNGQIKYEAGKDKGSVFFNTMTTPVGGEYRLVLPDGTTVWLNAASSITYPTAFVGKERNVSVSGEAYFEVAKNASMPFKVKTGEQVIEVLGTHFNVNAYANEHTLNTTLAEGKVKITENGKTVLLQPGQQVRNDRNGNLSLVHNPDMDEIMAWKDGVFRFNGTDIETIMRQVARWYGVEVVYKDKIGELFVAEIPRSVNVSKLLELLELTKQVRFSVNNKVITVTR